MAKKFLSDLSISSKGIISNICGVSGLLGFPITGIEEGLLILLLI